MGSLPAQRRPALIGAEHRAYCRRGNFLRGGAVGGVEWVVSADIAGEDVAVDIAVAGVDPAFHGTAIHMRAEAERLVARLTLAKPVGIEAFEIGVEFGPVL